MNERLALSVLADVMGWDDRAASAEYHYLAWMAAAKYDSYQDYVAGGRFLEHLVRWLQQFDPADREAAYHLVRHRLVFISASEMQRLVELFYPQVVEPMLVSEVSRRRGLAPWRVWADTAARAELEGLRRRCLFMGLSEGARLDRLRRANEGRISNEQVVLQTQVNNDKWVDLRKELRDGLGDTAASFEFVFLIDDFIASGTTLLRPEGTRWKGKLPRFAEVMGVVPEGVLSPSWRLGVHHYLANAGRLEVARERWTRWRAEGEATSLPAEAHFTRGLELRPEVALRDDDPEDATILALAERYYDPVIETPHMKKGGDHARRGFSRCALPLVLEHNTPNNSIPLIWAETAGRDHHAMRPLFYRRQRHG